MQVNCAAIPDELIESELFGHEKGSFTGAHEKKIGKFENAHWGTIFLDEIGDLSLRAQAKVLRVLEEGEVQPVGSAGNQEGQRAGDRRHQQRPAGGDPQGRFPRGPLFPAATWCPFIRRPCASTARISPCSSSTSSPIFSEENNYRRKKFSAAALQQLQTYDWKGNVRELRNLIERLLIMSESDPISEKDLPPYLQPCAPEPALDFARLKTWKDFKALAEKTFIEQKLKEFGFNVARTAREIDLPRSNLYTKIEALGIRLPEGEGKPSA